MKSLAKYFYTKLRVVSPLLYYLTQYVRATGKVKATYKLPPNVPQKDLFDNFVARGVGKRCLQIGVKDNIGHKYGPHWVSVDKYDMRDFIDHHCDIQDLEFENETFDLVVCMSVLEHIPRPHDAIRELHRVLKPGGEVWVQLPFLFPYHEAPKDYWRVTPDGLREWMRDFNEISCGCDYWDRTSIISATFFHGTK